MADIKKKRKFNDGIEAVNVAKRLIDLGVPQDAFRQHQEQK
jgi:hypothetical protein